MNNRSIVHSWESLEATLHHNSNSSLSYIFTAGGFRCQDISQGGLKEKYYTKTSAHVQPNTTAEGGECL